MSTTPPRSSPFARALLAAALLALAGCETVSTIASRSKEMSASLTAASPVQRELVSRGLIDLGFSSNLVFIALDKPDSISRAEDPKITRWIYRNFQQVPGNAVMGGTKVDASSQAGGRQYYKTTYSTRADPSQAIDLSQMHLVVTFTDGVVTLIELLER